MIKPLLIVGFGLLVGLSVYYWNTCKCSSNEVPKLDTDEWWGHKELKGRRDTTVKPFKVKFEAEMIADLKARLANHRPWAPPLEGAAFTYGFNSEQLEPWLKYWAEQYPFSEREKFLNQFPQYKTNIQGLDIHFIRVRPKVPEGVKILPLLLVHGWPGSVREFYEAIPLLTRQNPGYDFVFEVIVPSIPGYGFSDAAVRPGLGRVKVAVVMRNLMQRLGHRKYYIQGGDWGAVIVAAMATLFPDEVLGHHNNMAVVYNKCTYTKTLVGSLYPPLVVDSKHADKIYPLYNYFSYIFEEFGYFHLQATRPDTVGVSLSDSPSGLLAYILEKFSVWTELANKHKEDGGLTVRYTKDQLIDNLMLYWATNSITTSMRLYAESMREDVENVNIGEISTSVPTWVIQAKHELFYQPVEFLRTKYTNLLNNTDLEEGGHFLALEMPKEFSEDIFKAVKAFIEFNNKKVRTEL